MLQLRRIVLLAALSATLSGCPLFLIGPNIWHEVKREQTIDPATGDILRTFYWRSDSGDTATTTDVIRRGEDNEQRRGVRPTPVQAPSD
ncbi:hypothetical protein [Dongia sp. agr-C8]